MSDAASHNGVHRCFNVNCYQVFNTERGLRQHLWRSEACREYMSGARPLAGSVEISRKSTWRRRLGCGVESLRVNPFMSAEAPLYEPYELFDYSARNEDADGDDCVEFCEDARIGFTGKSQCLSLLGPNDTYAAWYYNRYLECVIEHSYEADCAAADQAAALDATVSIEEYASDQVDVLQVGKG